MNQQPLSQPVASPIAPSTSPLQPKPTPKLPLLIILPILIATIAGVIGFIIAKQKTTSKSPSSPTVVSTPIPNDPTANWKTYVNTTLHFSFKYPPSLQYIEDLGKELKFFKTNKTEFPALVIRYQDQQQITDPQKWITETSDIASILKSSKNTFFVLQSNGWYKSSNFISTDNNRRYAYLFKQDTVIEINTTEDETLDQILATFKFLDQDSETANWKTYTNTKLGLELKYPDDMEFYNVDPTMNWISSSSTGNFIEINIKMSLSDTPQQLLLNDGISEEQGWTKSKEKIRVGSNLYEYYSGSSGEGETYPAKTFAFTKNGVSFYFNISTFDRWTDVDQILSTFKFLNQDNETTNWETYINEKYQITFKYPKSEQTSFSKNALGEDYLEIDANTRFEISNSNIKECEGMCPKIDKIEDVSIGTIKFEKIYTTPPEDQPWPSGIIPQTLYIQTKLNEKTYATFTLGLSNKNADNSVALKTLDQILSTFKFLPSAVDGQRRAEIYGQIQPALEIYKADNQQYPPSLDALKPKYLVIIPVDPVTKKFYSYRPSANWLDYTITAQLEDGTTLTVNSPR